MKQKWSNNGPKPQDYSLQEKQQNLSQPSILSKESNSQAKFLLKEANSQQKLSVPDSPVVGAMLQNLAVKARLLLWLIDW